MWCFYTIHCESEIFNVLPCLLMLCLFFLVFLKFWVSYVVLNFSKKKNATFLKNASWIAIEYMGIGVAKDASKFVITWHGLHYSQFSALFTYHSPSMDKNKMGTCFIYMPCHAKKWSLPWSSWVVLWFQQTLFRHLNECGLDPQVGNPQISYPDYLILVSGQKKTCWPEICTTTADIRLIYFLMQIWGKREVI